VKYANQPLVEACREAVQLRDEDLKGDKGIIAADKEGNIALEFNSNVMRRAFRVGEGEPYMGIWKDE
jgi:beta-aspartyl-peptidase (threonine type)